MPKKPKDKSWIAYFDSLDTDDQRSIAIAALERLIEIGEVRHRKPEACDDDDEDESHECLFWRSCGEDLRIPF